MHNHVPLKNLFKNAARQRQFNAILKFLEHRYNAAAKCKQYGVGLGSIKRVKTCFNLFHNSSKKRHVNATFVLDGI